MMTMAEAMHSGPLWIKQSLLGEACVYQEPQGQTGSGFQSTQ